MKIHHFALAAGIALTLLTVNAQAQQAEAAASAAVAAPTTSPATDKAARKVALKAQRKADHMLEKTVRKALAKNKSIDVTRVNVRARSGAVTLLGSVPEQDQSDAAAQIAQGVSGVTSVKNGLTVKSAGE
jgi:hyperosmotically inducible periplasmic protein